MALSYAPSIADIEWLTKKRQDDLARLSPDERRSREFDMQQGYVNSPEEDLAKLAADIIESYYKLSEDALAELGVFNPDKEALREEAVALISPFFDQQLAEIQADIKEGRLQNIEDYNYRIQTITDNAIQALQPIAITEAQTEEELEQRLSDLGAREEYELAKTESDYETRRRAYEQSFIRSGKGFSGTMVEEMSRLAGQNALTQGEIARGTDVEEQAAQTKAEYTLERAQAARQEIEATKARETGRATQLAQRGVRQYGYDEGTPPSLIPGEETPEMGIYGSQMSSKIQRERDAATLAQINELNAQRQQELEIARRDTLSGLPTEEQYFSREYAKRRSSL